MDKIWNGKLISVPAMLMLAIGIMLDKLANRIFFYIHKPNFKSVGSGSVFYKNLEYRYPKNIIMGNDTVINKNVSFGSELADSKLIIGNNVSIAQNVSIDFTGDLIIEDDVTISAFTSIFTHDHGIDPRSFPVKRKLVIGKGTWIGANALVLHNVGSIGSDSIIAAGSVVVKPVLSKTIFGGNPAKEIGKLNIQDQKK